jgi:hypothetical protein
METDGQSCVSLSHQRDIHRRISLLVQLSQILYQPLHQAISQPLLSCNAASLPILHTSSATCQPNPTKIKVLTETVIDGICHNPVTNQFGVTIYNGKPFSLLSLVLKIIKLQFFLLLSLQSSEYKKNKFVVTNKTKIQIGKLLQCCIVGDASQKKV